MTEALAIIMLVLLIVLVIAGMRLGFVMMFLAVVFGLMFRGPNMLSLFMQSMFGTMSNEILIAVPLFIFMGAILERSGATEKLFETMFQLMGPVRGGLAIAAIIISTIFAACTGVIAASVTAMALIAMPAMLKRNYANDLATGVVCAGGSLGILIPPSVMLVMLGPMTQLSVARLFAGALVPGLMLAAAYLIYVVLRALLDPKSAPAIHMDDRLPTGRLLIDMVIYMIPILGLLVAVIGSILGGVASPTEASALGVLGATVIAVAYRSLNLKKITEAVQESLKITAMVFFVIVGAGMFTSVFLYMGGGRVIEQAILSLPLGTGGILVLMMATVFILGMLIDWIGILFVVVPIFMPIVHTLGLDPLWFIVLIAVNLQMSFITPPFAYAIFFVKGVSPPGVKTTDIYKGVAPFVAAQILVLALCIIFPQLILALPNAI
ncbi:MAG: TRAP transporter large permease subunit [Spirochaetes bacterium]|jgi:tripartite ATP-independent transporter DctM subunit|nr:TRAP transporter large permease subunit [Spirochaetota bacterium]